MDTAQHIQQLKESIGARIIGQEKLVTRLLVALLADGHLLVEGAPGLAKTKAVRVLSQGIEADFHRVQFTPDLLPADITGTDIFFPKDGSFTFQPGPLFHNLVLADEINRAPAKVQSALLEAMAEKQITVGSKTYTLPELFLVMATQNPIEQEGTYPLPEAQLDRFLLHVTVHYPDLEAGKKILQLAREEALNKKMDTTSAIRISQETIFKARESVLQVYMADVLEEYLLRIIEATHGKGKLDERTRSYIQYGASPRGAIALDRCSRAVAWLQGRDFVSPEDIHDVLFDVLRHRLLLTYEAEAEGVTPDQVIQALLEQVPVP